MDIFTGQVYIKEGLMGLQRSHFQFYIKVTDQNGFTGESKVKVDISSDYHLQKIPAFNQTAYVVNVNLEADVGATVFKVWHISFILDECNTLFLVIALLLL